MWESYALCNERANACMHASFRSDALHMYSIIPLVNATLLHMISAQTRFTAIRPLHSSNSVPMLSINARSTDILPSYCQYVLLCVPVTSNCHSARCPAVVVYISLIYLMEPFSCHVLCCLARIARRTVRILSDPQGNTYS